MTAALSAAPFSLRPLAAEDLALYVALFSDTEVMRAVGPPMATDRAKRAAASVLADQQAVDGRFRHWVIEHEGETIGLLGLSLRTPHWLRGSAELGVLLWPAWQARGVASRVIPAARAWAFDTVGLATLTCHHAEGHEGAAALMQRTGFHRVDAAPDAPLPCAWACHRGELTCVGLGMMLGAHLTPRARGWIDAADVVFVAASDALVEHWVQAMHPDVRSLQGLYAEGKPRQQTYRDMAAAMLGEVRAGRRVVGAFYGHPGVFAQVPHAAIDEARDAGYSARMDPGISAEDCLYADLGFDPGRVGCAHFEASQLLFYRRVIDTSAWLVLWQIGLAGDRTYAVRASSTAQRQRLVDRLLRDYPADHPVILYEAATLPIGAPRMETLPLSALAHAQLHMHTTLAVPPARALEPEPNAG